MGNSAAKDAAKDPCHSVLQEYIKCMEVHEGVKPAPYEPEYCTIEKDAYRDLAAINLTATVRKIYKAL